MIDDFILIAHGTDKMRAILKTLLKDAGYPYVSAVQNGRQLFARLERSNYDVLITAPELSDINCWQLLHVITTGRFCSPALPMLIVCNASQLPFLKPLAEERRVGLLASDELGRLADSVRTCLSGLQKPTVLVIEDHLDTAHLIKSSLKTRFEVEITLTGEAGLEAWRARQHQLVLLDLMLPGLGGPEVLQHIITEKSSQLVAIITARAERKTHRSLMLSGAAAFLTKPVDFKTLPRFCERLLQEGSLLRQRAQLEPQAHATLHMIKRVQVADFLLETGRPGWAAEQIKHALAQRHANVSQNDDDWIQLLMELDDPSL